MAVNFNQDSVFNLKPISNDEVRGEVDGVLIADEKGEFAFKTFRDQFEFTNKRIISIDVQGITGKRNSFATMPYSKIQYFSIQTPGFMELFPDSELFVMFTNGFTAKYEFKSAEDNGKIGRIFSEYV